MRKPVVVVAATAEPITAEEARLQCRADAIEDAYLAICIAGARAKCEGLIGQALITRTYEQTFDVFSAQMRLGAVPALAIVSVKYTGAAGAEETVDPADYFLDLRGLHPLLGPAVGSEWPTPSTNINAVRVRFTAGFGPASTNVPPDVRSWLLMTVGYLYAQREAFDMTGRVADIPSRFVDSLLDPYITHEVV